MFYYFLEETEPFNEAVQQKTRDSLWTKTFFRPESTSVVELLPYFPCMSVRGKDDGK